MKYIALALSVALSGCAAPPTKQQLDSADYGRYPSDYQQTIRHYMQFVLKDPASANYTFLNEPRTGWNSFGGLKFGYVVCAYINAKNSFGGYTGNRMSYFMIYNDSIIDASHGDGNYGEAVVRGKCQAFI